MAYLWWSLPVTTAAIVVSEPVPAVVRHGDQARHAAAHL